MLKEELIAALSFCIQLGGNFGTINYKVEEIISRRCQGGKSIGSVLLSLIMMVSQTNSLDLNGYLMLRSVEIAVICVIFLMLRK